MARQGDLFAGAAAPAPTEPDRELILSRQQLLDWQGRLAAHQGPLFSADRPPASDQGLLFALDGDPTGTPASVGLSGMELLALHPQPMSFWRWPQADHRGAALYFVTDHPSDRPHPLLLYVGETAHADRRWKGEHDCKSYLARYGEALQRQGLIPRLSIRFWLDAPTGIRARRTLEQVLIQHWLPPFNKETRQRWQAPFTALEG